MFSQFSSWRSLGAWRHNPENLETVWYRTVPHSKLPYIVHRLLEYLRKAGRVGATVCTNVVLDLWTEAQSSSLICLPLGTTHLRQTDSHYEYHTRKQRAYQGSTGLLDVQRYVTKAKMPSTRMPLREAHVG